MIHNCLISLSLIINKFRAKTWVILSEIYCNMLRNTNVTFFNDDRDQIKDVERLHRKALCLGYISKPIHNCKFKQYNDMSSECEDIIVLTP